MIPHNDLNGLVLAGGASKRMQTDKGTIDYHGLAQKYHVCQLLQTITSQAFISQRIEQEQITPYQYIIDSYKDIGFLSGILSAFNHQETAWMVIGCDYPLFGEREMKALAKARNKNKLATIIQDESSGFLIPSLAIYEKEIYPLLLDAVSRKKHSLQRLLRDFEIEIVKLNSKEIQSVDTPEEAIRMKQNIRNSDFTT